MIQHLIESYGYWAVLIGTFLEGETILVLAGFAAHQGYLNLTGVILAAFCGSLGGDQLFFYLGRRHSAFVLARHPAWKIRIVTVDRMLLRFQNLVMLSFRFFYGFRTVTPFVIGMSSVAAIKFVVFNAIGALVWAAAIGTGGYVFGRALETVLGKAKHYESYALIGIGLAGMIFWLWQVHRRRRNSKLQ
jgi:membrane protein DedA with SNARE-associated domain